MKIFAIGDLHLSLDEKVQKPMDVFGGEWVDHAHRLKKNWLEKVSADDAVIICGDISWGLRLEEAEADFNWLRQLPGRKFIFKGNHDLWWQSAGKLNRLYGDENMIFVQNTAGIIDTGEERVALCGSRGWICPGDPDFTEEDEKIYSRELQRLAMSLEDGKRMNPDRILGVLHYPPTNDKMQSSGFTELMSSYGVSSCVYGHLHGREAFKHGIKGVFNGVRYELVSLDYLEACPKEVRL